MTPTILFILRLILKLTLGTNNIIYDNQHKWIKDFFNPITSYIRSQIWLIKVNFASKLKLI